MKTWSSVFNIFAILIIIYTYTAIYDMIDVSHREFEGLRLALAVDYSTEGAFRSAMSTDSLGTDYANNGLEEIEVGPGAILDTFYCIMCANYDLSFSDYNKYMIEQSIATGVLATVDGYYIIEEVEVDDTPYDKVVGYDYSLMWGVKRPYIVYNSAGTRLYAASLLNEKTIEYTSGGLVYRDTFDVGVDITSEDVQIAISNLITSDMNYAIHQRNIMGNIETLTSSFYIPSAESYSTINNLVSPTLMLVFQNSEFLNGYDLSAISVGGVRVKSRVQVIGFKVAGTNELFYCYAGQQLDDSGKTLAGITEVARFDTFHDAAEAGYKPHMVLLQKEVE